MDVLLISMVYFLLKTRGPSFLFPFFLDFTNPLASFLTQKEKKNLCSISVKYIV